MRHFRGPGGRKARQLDRFIAELLSRATVEAAAKAAGISSPTAYRWLGDPHVVQRLAEARKDAMGRAMARLQEAAPEAVDCLCAVMAGGDSESARVAAARTVIEQALRAVELGDIQGALRQARGDSEITHVERGNP